MNYSKLMKKNFIKMRHWVNYRYSLWKCNIKIDFWLGHWLCEGNANVDLLLNFGLRNWEDRVTWTIIQNIRKKNGRNMRDNELVWNNLSLKVYVLFKLGWIGFKMTKMLVLKSMSVQFLKDMMDMAGLLAIEKSYFKYLDSALLSKFRSISWLFIIL